MGRFEISENGLVWDLDTNRYLGVIPSDQPFVETVKILGDIRCQLARIDTLSQTLRREGQGWRSDILDDALRQLRGQSDVEREAA